MNPSDNPAEQERTRRDKDVTETMNQENATDDSGVAPNTEGTEWDLTEMSAAPIGHNQYRVLSTRNDSVNHYLVDIAEGTCSCPSEVFNLKDNEACPHLSKAILVDAQREEEARITTDLSYLNDRAKGLMYDLRDTVDFAKTLAENNAKQYTGESSSPDSGSSDSGSSGDSQKYKGPNAEDKRAELQAAFDDVVDDMQTEVSDGLIWIQTGKDTPDTIPGPGNVQVFDAFLKNPEQVTFVHDDHHHASKRPGQWWKNVIDPSEVDEYIAEVLQ